nr:hypothetical protein [Tanacetum cinerariifolium]
MDKEYQPFALDGLEEEDMELDVDVDEDVYKDLLLHPEVISCHEPYTSFGHRNGVVSTCQPSVYFLSKHSWPADSITIN